MRRRRAAATLLRQAGEQALIAQASQALTADTTLLDQARQRFRTAARL